MMRNKLDALRQQAQNRLDELNPRERRLVQSAAVVLGVAVLWTLAVEPAWTTLSGAEARLQATLNRANAVSRAAQDLQAMQGAKARVQVNAADLDKQLQRLLQEEGLADTSALSRTEEGMIRVELKDSSAGAVLKWLAQAEAFSGLKVAEVSWQKKDAGVLSGHVTFATSASGGAR